MRHEIIRSLRTDLQNRGSASFEDEGGRTVVLALSGLLGVSGKGRLMVAYEGRGCMFFDGERPLNQFRMLSAGFGSDVASYISGIVNQVVLGDSEKDKMAKALEWKGNGNADHV